MVYGIQRFGRPGQKATVPGEYRPLGMGRGGNTYIQVNNYGNANGCCGNSRGWNCNAWANMDHHCHHDEGESTFGKVLGWTGVGMSALGTILDWIGVGKKSES